MRDRTKFGMVWLLVTVAMTVTIMMVVENAYGSAMGYMTYLLFWVGITFGVALRWGVDNTK